MGKGLPLILSFRIYTLGDEDETNTCRAFITKWLWESGKVSLFWITKIYIHEELVNIFLMMVITSKTSSHNLVRATHHMVLQRHIRTQLNASWASFRESEFNSFLWTFMREKKKARTSISLEAAIFHFLSSKPKSLKSSLWNMKGRRSEGKWPVNISSPSSISDYFQVLFSHLQNILLRHWNQYYEPFEKKKRGKITCSFQKKKKSKPFSRSRLGHGDFGISHTLQFQLQAWLRCSRWAALLELSM